MEETEIPQVFPVTLAIASTGRREILERTISHIASLAVPPDQLILSLASEADIDRAGLPDAAFPIEILIGPKGSCHQRNSILDRAPTEGALLFLDDDFLIADTHVKALRDLFTGHPDVVMATGRVLADGIHGPGFDRDAGLAILAKSSGVATRPKPSDIYCIYGCNMSVRAATLSAHPERFDEELPRYGWLEDMDFCRRVARQGRIVRDDNLLGVHLGTKTGRSAGVFLGYSQIANPVHFLRKGTVDVLPLAKLMTRNILANIIKSVRPEPWIDRRGRLRGNLVAIGDLLRGRCRPGRILELS